VDILASCDFYSCECQRDVGLAERLGLSRGAVLPVLPNSGGLDLYEVQRLREKVPPSRRRAIMLKGYQDWAGRALVGLRALERCAEMLADYRVVIYSAGEGMALSVELFRAKTGIETIIIPQHTSHQEMLKAHGQARISIGLSISDAISTSFLEAMAMGSFPIQSNTSCANEWAEHGRTALFVPPEDPEVVEAAVRRALTDDALVDSAASANWQTVQERLNANVIRPTVIEMYRRVVAGEPPVRQELRAG
jgi:glycosyltransferase involved in cell wall biosynthesis